MHNDGKSFCFKYLEIEDTPNLETRSGLNVIDFKLQHKDGFTKLLPLSIYSKNKAIK